MTKLLKRKKLERITELHSMGLNNNQVANRVDEEFKDNTSSGEVNRIVQRQAVVRKQLITTDKEFKEIHKSMLLKFIGKIDQGMDVLEKIRNQLDDKLKELKQDIPESKLMGFSREISNLSRTLNDTARTMELLLKRTETETSEVKFSMIDNIQNTVNILKELEKQGYIIIMPEFQKSEMFKEVNKDAIQQDL